MTNAPGEVGGSALDKCYHRLMLFFRAAYAALALLSKLALAACDDDGQPGIGGSPPATVGTSTGADGTGTGTGTPSSTTGTTTCEPGVQQPCYSGPMGTDGVGTCQPGTETCLADGSGFGDCEGEVVPARETCDALADEDCDGLLDNGCPSPTLWSKRFGDASPQSATVLATDSAGNVIVAGYYGGEIDLGGGSLPVATPLAEDIFVAKLDPAGNHIWSKGCGGGSSRVWSLTIDADDNVVFAGSFSDTADFGGEPLAAGNLTNGFLAKLDAYGNHIFSRRLQPIDGELNQPQVAVDAAGNIFFSVVFFGTLDLGGDPLFGFNQMDIALAKLDPLGNHLWSRRFGDPDQQIAYSLGVDDAGNVIMTGAFYGTIDFGGGPLTSTATQPFFEEDGFMVKLDPSGNHLWSQRVGGYPDAQTVVAQAPAAAGDFVVVGAFGGELDFGGAPLTSTDWQDIFVARLDADGQHVWSELFGGVQQTWASSVATDSAGNVLLTGIFDDSVVFGPSTLTGGLEHMFVAKLSPAGDPLWSRAVGEVGALRPDIATDGAGNVLVAGSFKGTIDFGNAPLTSAGDDDVFVAKLAP